MLFALVWNKAIRFNFLQKSQNLWHRNKEKEVYFLICEGDKIDQTMLRLMYQLVNAKWVVLGPTSRRSYWMK